MNPVIHYIYSLAHQSCINKRDLKIYFIGGLQIRYEFYNNCNLTEVGEPFAEQPYAVAVQQGSHLQVT